MPLSELQKQKIKSAERIDLNNVVLTVDDTIEILIAIRENKTLKRLCMSSHQIPNISKIDLDNSTIDMQPFYYYIIILAVIGNPAFLSIEISNKNMEDTKILSSSQSAVIETIKKSLAKKNKLFQSHKNLVEFNQAFLSGSTDTCLKIYPLVEHFPEQMDEFLTSLSHLANELQKQVLKLVKKEVANSLVDFANSDNNLEEIISARNEDLNKKGLNIEDFKKLDSVLLQSETIVSIFDHNQINKFSELLSSESIEWEKINKSSAQHIVYLNENGISKLKNLTFSDISSNEMNMLMASVRSQKGLLQIINIKSTENGLISFSNEKLILKNNNNVKWLTNSLDPQLLQNIKSVEIENFYRQGKLDEFLTRLPKLEKFYLNNKRGDEIISFDEDTLVLKHVNLSNIRGFLALPQMKNIKILKIENCFTNNNEDINSLFKEFKALEKLDLHVNQKARNFSWNQREHLADLAVSLVVNNSLMNSLNLDFCNDYGFFTDPNHGLKKVAISKIFKAIAQHNHLQNLDLSSTPLSNKEKSALIEGAASGFVPLTDIKFSGKMSDDNKELKVLLDRNNSILNKTRLKTGVIIREAIIGELREEVNRPFWNRKTVLLSFVSLGIYIGVRFYQRYKTKKQLEKLEREQQSFNRINSVETIGIKDNTTGYKEPTNGHEVNNTETFSTPIHSMSKLLQNRTVYIQQTKSDQKEEDRIAFEFK